MLIFKRIIPSIVSIMILCTCFTSQAVTGVSYEGFEENYASVQDHLENATINPRYSEDIIQKASSEPNSEFVNDITCESTSEVFSEVLVETTLLQDFSSEPIVNQTDVQNYESIEPTEFEIALPEESTSLYQEPVETTSASDIPYEAETSFLEETVVVEIAESTIVSEVFEAEETTDYEQTDVFIQTEPTNIKEVSTEAETVFEETTVSDASDVSGDSTAEVENATDFTESITIPIESAENKDDNTDEPDFSFDYSELELGLGEIQSLCSENLPSCDYTFTSDNPSVVNVNRNGDVFALDLGVANISCETSGKTLAKCRIKVLPAASAIWFNTASLKLGIGECYALKCFIPEKEAAFHRMFRSDNPGVAVVSSDGVIEAVGEGTAVISCETDDGVKTTCFVRVCAPASSIWFDFESAKMGVGETYTLISHIPDGEVAFYRYYSSSDSNVVKVSNDGIIKAIGEGTADVYCTTENGLRAGCRITVGKAATTLALDRETLTLGIGEQYRLECYLPKDEFTIYKYFYSDNPSVAVVDRQSGIVTAVSEGMARINCSTKNGARAYCLVKVRKMAGSVSLNKTSVTLGIGESFDFDSYVPDGCAAYYRSYYSENKKIASIAEAGGLMTAVSQGSTRIYCQLSNGVKTYCDVTVKSLPNSVSLGSNRTAKVGEVISVSPDFGTNAFSLSLVYSSSDAKVAKIESVGYDGIKIRAMSEGTATISVKTYNGKTHTIKITVSGSAAKCIDISTWQGDNVDFNKLKASGIEYVILRAGFSETKDNRFEKYYRDARAAGMKIGVYWYLYASTPNGAAKEANACLNVLKGKYLDMPVYCDIEEEYIVNQKSASDVTGLALSFGEIIKSGGFRPGVYASASVLYRKINRSSLKGYSIWNAEWNGSPTEVCDIWQYSETGRVSGISGYVDLDLIMNLNIVS